MMTVEVVIVGEEEEDGGSCLCGMHAVLFSLSFSFSYTETKSNWLIK